MSYWDKLFSKDGAFKKLDPGTGKEDAEAKHALEDVAGEWDGLEVPELGELGFDPYQYQGDFTADEFQQPDDIAAREIGAEPDVSYLDALSAPDIDAQQAFASEMGPTAFEGISTDPRLRDSQLDALGGLDEIIEGGGLTMRDQANLSKVRSDVGAADRGRRDALMQNMQARGMGGSGMELLAALQSGQAATDRESQAGLEQAAMAQERAQQAMMQRGQMAGSMRGQDFDEASRVAQAQDAIKQFNAANANNMSQFNAGAVNDSRRFNAGQTADMNRFNAGNRLSTDLANRDNRQGVQQWNAGQANDMARFNQGNNINVGMHNTDARNAANAGNWEARQATANANTESTNAAKKYNTVDKPLAQFGMGAEKLKGKTQSGQDLADFWTRRGDRRASAMSMGAAGGAQTAASIYGKSDERCKEDIEEISDHDVEEFLDALKPKSFRFKKGEAPDGSTHEKAGFMMQDIEGTKLGDLVSQETPDGDKGYDPESLQGVLLAILKKVSDDDEEGDDDVAV